MQGSASPLRSRLLCPHTLRCAALQPATSASIRSCALRSNGVAGLNAHLCASATLTDCRFQRNEEAAVCASSGGSASLHTCSFSASKGGSVSATGFCSRVDICHECQLDAPAQAAQGGVVTQMLPEAAAHVVAP